MLRRMIVIVVILHVTISNLHCLDSEGYKLKDLINIALNDNDMILQVLEEREKSKALLKQAYSALIPDLNFNYSYTETDLPVEDQSAPLKNYVSLALSQPIYTGGKTSAAYKTAKEGELLAENSIVSARRTIVLEIAKLYFEVLKVLSYIDVTNESLKQVMLHKKLAVINYEAGRGIKSDVLRMEVREASIASDLNRFENALQILKEQLCFLLGGKLKGENLTIFSDKKMIEKTMKPPKEIETLYQDISKNRPDILAYKNQNDINEYAVAIEKGDLMPNLNMEFSYNWKGDDFFPEDDDWRVGAYVSWKILDGGYLRCKVLKAIANKDQSEKKLVEKEKEVVLNIKITFMNIKTIHSNIQLALKEIDLANENLRIIEEQYKQGLVTSLSLIDSQLSLFNARTSHINLLYDYKKEEIKYMFETGHNQNLFQNLNG